MNSSVDIFIIHLRGDEILFNCLKSLEKTNYDNFKIKVLLQEGTKELENRIKRRYKRIEVYLTKKNLGFTGGNLFLLGESIAEYIVLLNNDVEVDKNWLIELVNVMNKKKASAAQPKILDLKNKNYFEYAGAAGGFMDIYGYPFCQGRLFETIEKDVGQYEHVKKIFWGSGAALIIKKEKINEIGFLDNTFFMYSEELDFCWRIALSGGEIFYVPKSKVYHLGNFSVNKEKAQEYKEYLIHRNILITLIKNYSYWSLIKRLPVRVLLDLVSGIKFFPLKFKAVIDTYLWCIGHSFSLIKKHNEIQKIRKVDDKGVDRILLKKSLAYLYFVKDKKLYKQIENYI